MKLIVQPFSMRPHYYLAAVALFLSSLLFTSELTLVPATKSSARTAGALTSQHSQALIQAGPIPPSDAFCRARFNIDCYGPQQMREIYNISPLLKAGYTGKGQTIVIIDSYGSPTINEDLKAFDAGFGLPDPPSFKVLAPLGTHTFDDSVADDDAWALESTLDVEWAHAIAPDANIVLLTSPVDETQGIQGLPEFLQLEQYALDNHLGTIISQSWGTAENTLFTDADRHMLNDFNAFYKKAAANHITVFASTGDYGTANNDVTGNVFPYPTVQFPASSPYVTAVGGTEIQTAADGTYLGETAWDVKPYVATGGGISQYFAIPEYQAEHLPKAMQQQLNGHRGIPDIAYNAYAGSSVLFYFSFRGAAKAGYYNVGGTSEGPPQWAGITAIANQYGHRPLGFLNEKLYELADSPAYSRDFHDITSGNNGLYDVPGYDAAPGWDLLTGWGSPNVNNLVHDLVEDD